MAKNPVRKPPVKRIPKPKYVIVKHNRGTHNPKIYKRLK